MGKSEISLFCHRFETMRGSVFALNMFTKGARDQPRSQWGYRGVMRSWFFSNYISNPSAGCNKVSLEETGFEVKVSATGARKKQSRCIFRQNEAPSRQRRTFSTLLHNTFFSTTSLEQFLHHVFPTPFHKTCFPHLLTTRFSARGIASRSWGNNLEPGWLASTSLPPSGSGAHHSRGGRGRMPRRRSRTSYTPTRHSVSFCRIPENGRGRTRRTRPWLFAPQIGWTWVWKLNWA